MAIYIGNNAISAIYIGEDQVLSIYLGTDLIYPFAYPSALNNNNIGTEHIP